MCSHLALPTLSPVFCQPHPLQGGPSEEPATFVQTLSALIWLPCCSLQAICLRNWGGRALLAQMIEGRKPKSRLRDLSGLLRIQAPCMLANSLASPDSTGHLPRPLNPSHCLAPPLFLVSLLIKPQRQTPSVMDSRGHKKPCQHKKNKLKTQERLIKKFPYRLGAPRVTRQPSFNSPSPHPPLCNLWELKLLELRFPTQDLPKLPPLQAAADQPPSSGTSKPSESLP
ncbi:uncharacterized protein C3orf22 homolog isoform X2 [Mastomys coucha]|uniref:uncharacterized protein C3orf22 homolog isoform X2 n=1 Tax=Mastomys coucha TaxID=35658 RepID=UPI0012624A88|nr:uncharacterized protein C3orf22 homolog isoform X2 [Mastomys coucha]